MTQVTLYIVIVVKHCLFMVSKKPKKQLKIPKEIWLVFSACLVHPKFDLTINVIQEEEEEFIFLYILIIHRIIRGLTDTRYYAGMLCEVMYKDIVTFTFLIQSYFIN